MRGYPFTRPFWSRLAETFAWVVGRMPGDVQWGGRVRVERVVGDAQYVRLVQYEMMMH